MLLRQTVDLVITDARLPGESGLQLAQSATEIGIASILMSGDVEWSEEHGLSADQYLAKPFDMNSLKRLVSIYLVDGSLPETLANSRQ